MAETHGKLKFILLFAVAVAAAAVCFIANIAFPQKYEKEIARASEAFGVEAPLIRAVILAESGYDESALSAAGASGLMQLMPGTRAMMSERTGIAADGSAESEIMLGTAYLSLMLETFDSEDDALAAYNAGPANVARWNENGEEPFGETREYVAKVKLYRRVYARIFAI